MTEEIIITVLHRFGTLTVLAHSSRVLAGGADTFEVYLNLGANGEGYCAHRYEDQGVTWVFGHVTDKDEEGRALLAAAALQESRSSIEAASTVAELMVFDHVLDGTEKDALDVYLDNKYGGR